MSVTDTSGVFWWGRALRSTRKGFCTAHFKGYYTTVGFSLDGGYTGYECRDDYEALPVRCLVTTGPRGLIRLSFP